MKRLFEPKLQRKITDLALLLPPRVSDHMYMYMCLCGCHRPPGALLPPLPLVAPSIVAVIETAVVQAAVFAEAVVVEPAVATALGAG